MLRQGLLRAGACLRLTEPAATAAWAPALSARIPTWWSDEASFAKKVATNAAEAKAAKAAKRAAKAAEKAAAKPKRPKVAYAFFTEAKYNELKEPGEQLPVVTRKIAALWKTLSDAEKAPFQAKGDADKERHANEMAAWEKINPPEPPKLKRKPSGYTIFVQEDMAKQRRLYPSMTAREMLSTVASNWKVLTDIEKQEYKDKAATAK